jgi:anaerobic magnesium-protoporphyrin IX monomethyl ester cyclase
MHCTLRLLSAQLTAQDSPIDWCGAVRLERALSKQLPEAISRSGGWMLFFGLETASERMIEHMGKDTQRETMSHILEENAQAGIRNHTFYFFGFPTETVENVQDTIDFLYAHQASIHSASPGEFVLECYSPGHRDPARFGVRRSIEKSEQDLAVHFGYELESGIDAATVHTIGKQLLDDLPAKRFFQFYVHDVYFFTPVTCTLRVKRSHSS